MHKLFHSNPAEKPHWHWSLKVDVVTFHNLAARISVVWIKKYFFIFILFFYILQRAHWECVRAGRRRGLNPGGQEGGADPCYSMVWYSMAQTPRWLAFLSLICLHVGGLAWLPTTVAQTQYTGKDTSWVKTDREKYKTQLLCLHQTVDAHQELHQQCHCLHVLLKHVHVSNLL